jgi:predicted ATP-grasp superfamily ATP-dependent carboligase
VSVTVFVTDGNERPALAIVRSLGRAGATVIVGETRPDSLAAASKYAARTVPYPSPALEPLAFERFLVGFVEREHVDVLVPVTDLTTYAAARCAATLRRRCAMATPPFEAFDAIADKATLVDLAVRNGIRVPRTLFVQGSHALPQVIEAVRYPAVIKPARSRLWIDGQWIAAAVHYAEDESALRRLYAANEYLTRCPSLIQERIVGPGVGVFVLFDRGRVVAEFAHRRLRERPPSGGASVLRESIAVPAELRSHARRLLCPLCWHGVAMLEYKHDAARNEFMLMEVNGRFWGSLQLAIDAGIDFPRLACDLALGRTPATLPRYSAGVKSRWILGDLDHLLLRLARSTAGLKLPPGAPSRMRVVGEFLRFIEPQLHYEVISRDDPAPFRRELRAYLGELAGVVARRLRSRPAVSDTRPRLPKTTAIRRA